MSIRTFLTMAAGASALVAIAAASPATADDGKLEELKGQGFARVAIANEPPFTAVAADGKVSGAAPDVAREVFKRLGVGDIVASISEYGAMIPGLQAGRHDVITAGLFMKPERCAAVAYSEPILCDAEAFALKKGNPLGLKSYKDIADNPDAKIGAPGGGTEEKLALEAGVPRDRVIVVPDGQSGLKMLQDGRIDVYSLPVLSINDLVSKANDPNIEVVAPVEGAPVYCDGAAFRKGDEALRDAFDVELAKLKESGEFAKIIEPYGFSAAAAMSTTREKLCAAQ
ncbi:MULTISPECIES: ectoine/hydroxyectoine ABC transporter substrate-binding protein EhuB [unclassified Shinella]|uniref:ectoine/hydroxyectoine ABC transporter substrate-binding protein EhuB n=1 Tax=unclassified Shinella TaxID=2643062 RepID=UPI00225D9EA5|nr:MULTISPECIES: ectoine/hydroxyectoine ABC transporter substrate-binding protein EhuB [unclassified Shinella]MCO5137715.1 ectoine/hydroxyectoine ABC transporter substrate-binding protein EhuB [Shinella sp.]MDC7257833.1 ectoine/hydroxyectoine ABC transporter substrate-binding protein EhuB [Shinella sp. YE25]CAI0335420.1 Ectoine-binding protein /hydroxyectoine-binding protein [Rhizobiaceae bacterium]CAK7259727.1 polar amino acid transport system substrate-binding protein [Shinella sp. WSC3-e]